MFWRQKKIFLAISFGLVNVYHTPLVPMVYNKHVIGCQSHGFFSIFFGVLNHLFWCEKYRQIPVVYWGPNCLYYDPQGYNGFTNAWEYYFEPVSSAKYTINDVIHDQYYAPDNSCIEYRVWGGMSLFGYRDQAHRIIRKYIKVKNHINSKVECFYRKNMERKKTIGIHLRGTDKYKECIPVAMEKIFKAANEYTDCQFLIATDEENLLQLAKENLLGPVIFYPVKRSHTGVPVHLDENQKNKALIGEEVLIEVLLLAKCQYFIHTTSNVAAAVYFFNPHMHGTFFTTIGKTFKIKPTKSICPALIM